MYWIDTSALLHGWKRDYPREVFCSLWENLDKLIEESRLSAPDEVLLELERGGDDIYYWAKQRRSMFVSPEKEIQEIITKIVDDYPNFIPETSHDGIWADPWVIAFAIHFNGIVVTGEKPKGSGAKMINIPNVCAGLGIECINFLDLICRENWRF